MKERLQLNFHLIQFVSPPNHTFVWGLGNTHKSDVQMSKQTTEPKKAKDKSFTKYAVTS